MTGRCSHRRRRGGAQAAIVALAILLAVTGPAAGQTGTGQTGTGQTGADQTAAGGQPSDRGFDALEEAAGAGLLEPPSESEQQGYGCLIGTGMAGAIGMVAGPGELVLLMTGSNIVPANPVVFALAFSATALSGLCALGALAAPAAVRLWNLMYISLYSDEF